MGKVTEMPLDRLDRCSAKRRRATRRGWTESQTNRRHLRLKIRMEPGRKHPTVGNPVAEQLLQKKGGHRENEAVANAKDGGLNEFRSQYARARRVSQALRLRSAHDQRALPTVHSAGPVWRFIGTVRRRKAGGTIRRIVCRRGGRGTSRLW